MKFFVIRAYGGHFYSPDRFSKTNGWSDLQVISVAEMQVFVKKIQEWFRPSVICLTKCTFFFRSGTSLNNTGTQEN